MRYISTRGGSPAVGFVEAVLAGLAPDGGLYVPETWPSFETTEIAAFAGRPGLRVEVASSAFPLFDRNPGSGVPSRLASPRDWLRARQQVLHDPGHPSRVELPMLEEPLVPCTPP